MLGRTAGKNLVTELEQNYKLKSKEALKIDIVSHSMGFAYSLGLIEVLQQAGYQIGWLYAFAPENPGLGSIPDNIEGIWQYGSDGEKEPFAERDGIAPQEPIPGIDDLLKGKGDRVPINCNEEPCGQIESHKITNFGWVFRKIKPGDRGYVKPRK